MLEYPLEPRIGYGVFNYDGRPIQPGVVTSGYQTGFGILNCPKNFHGLVVPDASNRELGQYLQLAKTKWEEEKSVIDFENIPNKWECLLNRPLKNFDFYSDMICFSTYFDEAVDYDQPWRSIVIQYDHRGVKPGILPIDEILTAMQLNYPRFTSAVQDEDGTVTLTTDGGVKFAIMPRFLSVAHTPQWAVETLVKQSLHRQYLLNQPQDSQELAQAA